MNAEFDTFLDADGEIAAVIYNETERPDALLSAMVHEAREAGLVVCGCLQNRSEQRLSLDYVPATGGPLRPLADQTASDHDCQSISSSLDASIQDSLREVEAGCDLVVINRFGRLEASRKGFWRVVAAAHARSIPVLIPVHAAYRDSWRSLTNGMCVELRCNRATIGTWLKSRLRRA